MLRGVSEYTSKLASSLTQVLKDVEVLKSYGVVVQTRSQHHSQNLNLQDITLPQYPILNDRHSDTLQTLSPMTAYLNAKDAGLYREDELQMLAAQLLQNLFLQLSNGQPLRNESFEVKQDVSSWWRGFGGLLQGIQNGQMNQGEKKGLKGVYMFGGVGTGKTMLMDMFARGLVATRKVRVSRMHFHDFMISVHQKLRTYSGQKDPLCMVANEILKECSVLCLDELFVTDVADAMILSRLFGKLWNGGLVLVATSNRHPDSLYEGGLQQELFLPFTDSLKNQCIVHDMASSTDHRQLAQQQRGSFFVGQNSTIELRKRFSIITDNQPTNEDKVEVVMGRKLKVRRAVDQCCCFEFSELCDQPLSAADYIALAEKFHTIAVSNIPVFKPQHRSSAYRFVALIDVLYERRTRLLCSAEGSHEELLKYVTTSKDQHAIDAEDVNDLLVDNNLGFSKHRTVSRLGEMQSVEYAIEHAERYEPQLLMALKEVQQKFQ